MFKIGELFKNPQSEPTVAEEKKKVLVIEDEREISEVYKQILTERGFDTYVAVDGQEGLKKIVEVFPDLIFLDIRMPVMDGKSMLAHLKNDIGYSKYRNIPVIMLTNSGNTDNIRDTERLGGANEFIVKANINPSELADVADRYLR